MEGRGRGREGRGLRDKRLNNNNNSGRSGGVGGLGDKRRRKEKKETIENNSIVRDRKAECGANDWSGYFFGFGLAATFGFSDGASWMASRTEWRAFGTAELSVDCP